MRQRLAGFTLLLLCGTASAAGVPQTASLPQQAHQDTWLDNVASVDLSAVDGSHLRFVLDDAGMTRHISGNGSEQVTSFVFLNHDLGTVRDSDADITGFFRRTADGLEITYADGRLETVTLLSDGGVAMTLHTPGSADACMGWYPQGHVFSDAEKRVALAHYAQQLGIALPAASAAPSASACPVAASHPSAVATAPSHSPAVADAPAAPVAEPPKAPARLPPHRGRRTAQLVPMNAPPASDATLPALTAVPVRLSEVHEVPAPQSPDPMKGASTCLTVDSDGGHWGFHNACTYDVEFAFCLKDAGNDLASCDKGARSGLVTANGFTPLVAAGVLGGNGAERRFRWIACGLSDGALEAHLDQTNPPAGRCTRPS